MYDLFRLEYFYLAFRIWTIISLCLGLTGIVIFLYHRRKKESRKKFIGAILFGQMWLSVLILMLINNTIQWKAKSELLHKINLSTSSIQLCDHELDEQQTPAYKQLLLNIGEIPRHHSSATYCGNIKLKSGSETIKLRFERDNNIKTEYWIYWDKYTVTKDNAIGYLRTNKLDEMNCR